MKKLLLLLFVTTLLSVNAQSSSFERGFRDGYCQAKKEDKGQYTQCATSPIAPTPKAGKESYQDGFVEGYKKYNDNSSNDLLIKGAADVGNSNRPTYNQSSNNQQNKKVRATSNTQKKSNQNQYENPSVRVRRELRTNKILSKNLQKAIKEISKYAYPSKDECPYTYDIDCKWILKDGYSQRDLRKFEQAKSEWRRIIKMNR